MPDNAQPPAEKLSPEAMMLRALVRNGVLPRPLLSIDEVLAEVRKRRAVERMFDCPEFPVDPNSLQERLLKFYTARKWLQKPREELREAEEKRRSVFKKTKKEEIFGVHQRGGLAKDYEYVFRPDTSPNELFELNRALLSNDPGKALSRPEVVNIIARKFSLGAGDTVIRFLAARLEAYHPVAKMGTQPIRGPVFNRALLIASEHWTDPAQPLWLMPGAAAAKIISAKINKEFSREAFNTMVRKHKLHRVHESVWRKLDALRSSSNEEGLKLREEFEEAMV